MSYQIQKYNLFNILSSFLTNSYLTIKDDRVTNQTMHSLSKSGLEVLKKWEIIDLDRTKKTQSSQDISVDLFKSPSPTQSSITPVGYLSLKNMRNQPEVPKSIQSQQDVVQNSKYNDILDSFVYSLNEIKMVKPPTQMIVFERRSSLECIEDQQESLDETPKLRRTLKYLSMQPISNTQSEKQPKQVKFNQHVHTKSLETNIITVSPLRTEPSSSKILTKQMNSTNNFKNSPSKKSIFGGKPSIECVDQMEQQDNTPIRRRVQKLSSMPPITSTTKSPRQVKFKEVITKTLDSDYIKSSPIKSEPSLTKMETKLYDSTDDFFNQYQTPVNRRKLWKK